VQSAAVIHETPFHFSSQVVKKLIVETPSPELVDAYLTEISKAYGVKYTSSTSIPLNQGNGNGGDGDVKEGDPQADTTEEKVPKTAPAPPPPKDDFDLLQERFAALKNRK
jgi:vacuolar protein sorting-associated protein IST1